MFSVFNFKKIFIFPVVWYLNVCKSANALFEYDYLQYLLNNAVMSPDLLCSQLANHCQSPVSLPPSSLKVKKEDNFKILLLSITVQV